MGAAIPFFRFAGAAHKFWIFNLLVRESGLHG
jgi:hypothetical protein